MFRIFSLLLSLFASFVSVFASDDLTSSDFYVDTLSIDPVHTSYADTSMGIGALNYVLGQFANLLIYMIPLIAGMSFIIAGYYYIFSSGDSEKASKAKTIIKWNIVAMVVAFLSYGLVKMVLFIMNV